MATDKLHPGQSHEIEVEVTRNMTTGRKRRKEAAVLSTPSLLGLMERTSIEASEPHIPDGYVTVGYAVDGMRHIAATLIGNKVRVKAVLTKVDRNRLTFEIEAFEGDKQIGVAIHKRAIISTDLDE